MLDRQVEASGVLLEVVGHLGTAREVEARGRERHPGQTVDDGRAVQPEGGPAATPLVADPVVGVDDEERDPAVGQLVPGRQAGLPGTDDEDLDPAGRLARHGGDLVAGSEAPIG